MRLVGRDAEALFPVFFVFGVIPVIPENLAIPLESKNMRCNAVEEPPVVRDDNGAAGKIHQRFLKRAERVHVEVICRLIEQKHVRPLLQYLCQMDTVAFSPRKLSGFFLLVGAAEIKARHIRTRINLTSTKL